MANELFKQLEEMTTKTIPVVLHAGAIRMVPDGQGRSRAVNEPRPGSTPIQFDIHTVTPNEVIDADAVITAQAPKIYETHPSPTRVGTVEVLKGYDEEDKAYLAQRQAQAALRNAMVCLFGCPALKESTPGGSTADKAASLMAAVPAVILDWLCQEIETIPVLTAVGEDAVASFLADLSAAGISSSGTSKPGPGGGKAKRSKDSTARTSPTKSANPPAGGG